CFETAAQADPASVQGRLSLAAWYERERRLDDALAEVEACLARHSQNAQALCVKALVLHRKNCNTEAEALLRDLIKRDSSDPDVKVSSRHFLGLVLDQLGQYQEALRWIAESKNLLRQNANIVRMELDYDQADRRRRELLSTMTSETLRRWKADPAPG